MLIKKNMQTNIAPELNLFHIILALVLRHINLREWDEFDLLLGICG